MALVPNLVRESYYVDMIAKVFVVSLVCHVMEGKGVLLNLVRIKTVSLNAKIFANLVVKKSVEYLAHI